MTTQAEAHMGEQSLAPDQDGVLFDIYVNGERVQCTVTGAALKSRFHSGDRPLLDVFAENQEVIRSLAAFLISTRPQMMDGALLIHPEDLLAFPSH